MPKDPAMVREVRRLQRAGAVDAQRRFVYILRSRLDPGRYYTGVTDDLPARLAAHNAGQFPQTARGRPWTIDVVVRFADERRAVAFERYLKSGAGGAFAERHLR
jgi:putative endonuclease